MTYSWLSNTQKLEHLCRLNKFLNLLGYFFSNSNSRWLARQF